MVTPIIILAAAAAAKSLQSCLTLCDSIDVSLPGSPVARILHARTLEWVAISFSNTWKWKVKVKSLSRPNLWDPMDCSPPGCSVHGIFQARVLEWGAIAFSDNTCYWIINILKLNIPLPSLSLKDFKKYLKNQRFYHFLRQSCVLESFPRYTSSKNWSMNAKEHVMERCLCKLGWELCSSKWCLQIPLKKHHSNPEATIFSAT